MSTCKIDKNLNEVVVKTATKWKERAKQDKANRENISQNQALTLELMQKKDYQLFSEEGQIELLKSFADYAQKRMWENEDKDLSEFVDEFLRHYMQLNN